MCVCVIVFILDICGQCVFVCNYAITTKLPTKICFEFFDCLFPYFSLPRFLESLKSKTHRSEHRSTITGSATISTATTHPMSNPSVDSMPIMSNKTTLPSADENYDAQTPSSSTSSEPDGAVQSMATLRKSNRSRAKYENIVFFPVFVCV